MRARVVWTIVALVLVAGAAGGVGGYALLHTRGSPEASARDFLAAWGRADFAAMRAVAVGMPDRPEVPYRVVGEDLGITATHLSPGTVRKSGDDAATAEFTATVTLTGGHEWSYAGRLAMTRLNRRWWVDWSPAAIHPDLAEGRRFQLSTTWPDRGEIHGANGVRLDSADAVRRSGSVEMITGTVGEVTAEDLERLGGGYSKGDRTGHGGVQQAYEARLAGSPATVLRIVDAGGRPVRQLARFPGKAGEPVRTSIDMAVQEAAGRAVRRSTKPTALVAVRPSTGEVLAVVNKPGGFDRALVGQYPPGSTFKVVTASGLAASGLTPASRVPCPKETTVGGFTFHNNEFEQLGATNLRQAFAHSCNTTFGMLAARRLGADRLTATAREFGFNGKAALGIPASLGRFPAPRDDAELAASAFGQGRVVTSPLHMASVAAAIADGSWRPPRLVTEPEGRRASATSLDQGVVAALRTMMRSVVTEGTAAGVGLPAGTRGKTGTAEYGTGRNPPAHAWFIGYRGDLAFAVVVEGGGLGADHAGPIAAAFLRGL